MDSPFYASGSSWSVQALEASFLSCHLYPETLAPVTALFVSYVHGGKGGAAEKTAVVSATARPYRLLSLVYQIKMNFLLSITIVHDKWSDRNMTQNAAKTQIGILALLSAVFHDKTNE